MFAMVGLNSSRFNELRGTILDGYFFDLTVETGSDGDHAETNSPVRSFPEHYVSSASETQRARSPLELLFITFTLAYDGNGNTGGTAPVDPNSPYNAGATTGVLGPGTLVKTGHQFVGWNTSANGSGTALSPAQLLSVNANTTLYAQWIPIPCYPSSLDTSFGIGGKVTTQFASTYDDLSAIALQPDGKLVAAGLSSNGTNIDFGVARFQPNGSLDTSFGTGGKVTTAIGPENDQAYSVAIQPDGKILVVGLVVTSNSPFDVDFGVVRYNINGSLDATFGNGGKVLTSFAAGSQDYPGGILVQPDGKIIVTGSSGPNASQHNSAIVRYNANGSLDPSFGTGGKVVVDLSGAGFSNSVGSPILLPDNKIVTAAGIGSNTDLDFGIARFNTNGSLDTSFGTGGRTITDIGNGTVDFLSSIAIQADGKFVAAGSRLSLPPGIQTYDTAVVRYNADGSVDSTFGSSGKLTFDLSGIGNHDGAKSVAIQPNGKIVIAGGADNASAMGQFALARFTSSGSLDPSFDGDGMAITTFPSGNGYLNSLVIQPDGKLTAGGGIYTGPNRVFGLVRYSTTPCAPPIVSVAVFPSTVFENSGATLTYVFTLSGQQAIDLPIAFTFGGTAIPGTDYNVFGATPTGGSGYSVNVPAGQTTATVTIVPINDALREDNETVIASLVSSGNYVTGSPSSAIGTIMNDDCTIAPVGYGESRSGQINDSSCVVAGNKSDLLTFSGVAGQRVSIRMATDQFVPRLSLVDPGNSLVQQSAVTGTLVDASIPAAGGTYTLLSSGTYTIRARSPFGGNGNYTVSLYRDPQVGCSFAFAAQTNAVAAGGPYSFYVTTPPGCPVGDAPPADASIYTGLTYRNGLVQFNVTPNSGVGTRMGSIVIGGQVHLINQYGTAAPPNDNFANAEQISGAASSVSIEEARPDIPDLPNAPSLGYNTNATAQAGEPGHSGAAQRSVWYSWVAPPGASALYSFSTSGSSFDTVMAIYQCPAVGACGFASLVKVGSNDDTTRYDKTSKVNFRAEPGRRYMIAVDGKNGATGSIQLSWRQYERLFRLYLQNGNGFASQIVPTSITATTPANPTPAAPMFVSRGVYEFNLPPDNATYDVAITGPTGIVWPGGLKLSNMSSSPEARLGQNVVARPESTTDRFFIAYIKEVPQGQAAQLGVALSYERGSNGLAAPNARPEAACSVSGTSFSAVPLPTNVVNYQCRMDPQTQHDMFPNMLTRGFVKSLNRLDYAVQGALFVETQERALTAANGTTFNITGRVLQTVPDTTVKLRYTPPGESFTVERRPPIGPDGSFEFRNMPANISYSLTAEGTGVTYAIQPSSTFTLTQDTALTISTQNACTYQTPPIDPVSGNGGSFEVSVLTSPGCTWNATTDVDWIVISSGQAGDGNDGGGNGRIQITIPRNPTQSPRSGTFRIQDQAVTIQQLPGTPPLALEGDVVDGSGGSVGGDGVRSNDVFVIRQMVLGNMTVANSNQFQRADCAPRDPSLFGDGVIASNDVTGVRNYLLGIDLPTPAAGPTVASRLDSLSWVGTGGVFARIICGIEPRESELLSVCRKSS
jgi:uncharacterized delta-60 repeat protein/uncharacterized repeat protein (TIGR02543 family)